MTVPRSFGHREDARERPSPRSPFAQLLLALVLARRGLRTGARGLAAAFACLVLGVAAIGGVASLRASLAAGLAAQGRTLLGGDLAVDVGALPPSPALRSFFAARGARVSEIARLHAMLEAPSGKRMLVSLEAVDRAWPLVGTAEFAPAMTPAEALVGNGLAAAPLVLARLGLKEGASVRLGTARFALRASLLSAPDQATTGGALFGPPVVLGLDALVRTGLVVPGSLVRYTLRVVLPAGVSASTTEAALLHAFPDAGFRVRTSKDAAPGLARFLDRTAIFLTLVALTALLVGGVGVADGVGAWAEARLPDVATLRALGASTRLVAASMLCETLLLSIVAIVIGVAIGAAVPWTIAFFLGADLPAPAELGLYPGPLGLAAGFGLLTALLCMLFPILRAAHVSPARLFREPGFDRAPPLTPAAFAIAAALAAALLLLAIAATGAPRFVAFFALAAAVALVVLAVAGALFSRIFGRLRLGPVWLRLGLADLARPGAATGVMVVSAGLGLATLGAVALVQGNLNAAFTEEIPSGAPTFYFIDIQDNELPTFEHILRTLPGVEAFATVPMLRARVSALNGTPAAKIKASKGTRWALDQDLGLTYAARPPSNNRIVAGRWWPVDYRGPPLLSLGDELARGWGVRVGDTLTLNVLGRPITLRVTSLRAIAWHRLGLNFFLIASPGILEAAPHTNIATVTAAPATRAAVLDRVTSALPNVSAIEVAGVIATVGAIFARIATAGSAIAGLTLASGVLVLGVAIAAEERRQTRQAVILKVLGATRWEIRAAWLVRFAVIGVIAGALAAAIATAASFAVVRYVMHGHWVFLPVPLAATIAAAILLMLLAGFFGTTRALRAEPARWLARDA